MNGSSLKGSERGKKSKGEINRKDNEHHFFSAAQAIVIVVLKEACNELREYGIFNLLVCHKEQDYMECIRCQCTSFKVSEMEMKGSSDVVTPLCIKAKKLYCVTAILEKWHK